MSTDVKGLAELCNQHCPGSWKCFTNMVELSCNKKVMYSSLKLCWGNEQGHLPTLETLNGLKCLKKIMYGRKCLLQKVNVYKRDRESRRAKKVFGLVHEWEKKVYGGHWEALVHTLRQFAFLISASSFDEMLDSNKIYLWNFNLMSTKGVIAQVWERGKEEQQEKCMIVTFAFVLLESFIAEMTVLRDADD